MATQLTGIGGKKKPAEAAPVVVAKDQVGITERAAKKIAQLAEREGRQGQLLRVGIQGGGCSGLSYTFAFADKAEARDRIFDGYGQRIVVDAKSLLYLGGSVLDWTESLMKSGFVLKNPHEVKSCSCGESFSV
ncbi:MAG: iron-sulfur cluster assembly accessory protein [Deltaproteobacteria bacterium]|nr:iron-sulfur cluster assembly accessory protein [Deltaproteobacteria bacterium]